VVIELNNQIRVVVVEAGNPVIKVIEKFDHSLENLQKFVGGYIEAIRVNESLTIWINEEGKLLELDGNFYLTDQAGKPYDVVVGDALFAGTDEEGNTISLTDQEIDEIKERFLNRVHFRMF
jgi:Domain of unknown function (DUF3846)